LLKVHTGKTACATAAAFGRDEFEMELSFGKAVSSHPFLREGKPHSIKSNSAGLLPRCVKASVIREVA
jgi:hypothetical protein